MLVSMMNDSFAKRSVLYIVIETDNLERMEKADPITLESVLEGGLLPPAQFPDNFSMLIAYEPKGDELHKMARKGGVEFMRYLERGRVFKPEVDGKENARPIVTEKMN